MYDFDQPFDRRGTNCWKWDGEGKGGRIAMGCADTDFRMPEPIAQALRDKIAEGALTYPVNNDPTRQALQGFFRRHFDVELEQSWICDSVGMMNGLRLALEAWTRVGDAVIVQSPVFNYFNDTVENAGRHILDNHMEYDRASGRYTLDFDRLEAMCARPNAKMMLLCNPSNPTGRAYSREELLRISEICRRNGVLVVSDEIHANFHFGGRRHVSVFALPQEYRANSVVMTGPGKIFNTHGLYTAFFLIPDPALREAYLHEYRVRHMDYMELGMIAAAAGYARCDDHIEGMCRYIEDNFAFLRRFLSEHETGILLPQIDATYLIRLDFAGWHKTSDEIAAILKEYGLTLSGGAQYGWGADGFMRMDIATQRSTLRQALEILETAYREKIAR